MADGTDILMRIKSDRGYLKGECTAQFATNDPFTEDFQADTLIEIMDFDFGINLVDKESSGVSSSAGGKNPAPGGATSSSKEGKFSRFISMDGDPTALYPVTFDEVSVSRQMDSSSPVLLQNCFQCKTVPQITVVKRKASGLGTAGGLVPYLRVDFESVLVTDVSWEIGETVMREKMKFVCRKFTVKYRTQNADGSRGVTINSGPISLIKTKG